MSGKADKALAKDTVLIQPEIHSGARVYIIGGLGEGVVGQG